MKSKLLYHYASESRQVERAAGVKVSYRNLFEQFIEDRQGTNIIVNLIDGTKLQGLLVSRERNRLVAVKRWNPIAGHPSVVVVPLRSILSVGVV